MFGASARPASARQSAAMTASPASGRHSTRKADNSSSREGASMAPDKDMKTEPVLGHDEQHHGFDEQPAGGRNRGAGHSERRDEHEAEAQIDGERAGIDQRAEALLAEHVEQPLDRP